MSTVSLDASGARALTSTVNDPARTAASIPTKRGDSININGGSYTEARMVLPATARIERREYVTVRDEKEIKTTYHVLVVPGGSGGVFLRASENAWPHLTVSVKDWSKEKAGYNAEEGKHFTESGVLAETHTLVDLGLAETFALESGDEGVRFPDTV